ncbi:MAG TPA: lytic transglycosylase domain-containing protein [Candidatus Polarisedimenticolia bacterium]|nr:lytic transglycosylase domain-containing protein [Candidatus Polarisedimenticolia bacterium]
MKSGLCLSLLGLTVLGATLVGSPAWAPEDPWRVVGEMPGLRGPAVQTAEALAGFLDRAGVGLSHEAMLDIAESVALESQRHGMDPELLLSVIMVESRFRSDAVSHRGAIGLMQLLPSTAVDVADQLDLPWGGEMRLLEPRTNIALGAHYLSSLLDSFGGDVSLALTAYNKGPGYVQNMLASGVMESTATNWVSSYAESVAARLAQVPRGDGRIARQRPRPLPQQAMAPSSL